MKIKVGHMEIPIKPMDKLQRAGGNWGTFFPGEHEIIIHPKICPPEQARVLIHELIHAMWHANGMPEKVDEEEACSLLDRAFAELIRRNPILLPKLVDALNGVRPIVSQPRKQA